MAVVFVFEWFVCTLVQVHVMVVAGVVKICQGINFSYPHAWYSKLAPQKTSILD